MTRNRFTAFFFGVWILLLQLPVCVKAEDPGSLFSLSAVLMDSDSGRVLYGKEEDTPRPNASTTKVMTCILALERSSGDDYVIVSSNAAAQPDVQLGMEEGEQYYMEDLLYSLMLESHNDTAVAIAEHIGGSVEGFAALMNDKAIKLGCTDTHFVTANGLDDMDEGGIHRTTARDLSLIMRYAIKSKTFLHITQTREYTFSDIKGKRQFTVHNTNAFLDMQEGLLSGKTGFTADAGYCYVCACRMGEKTFIVSLLGCGWPNHKTYKWQDTKKLLNYGDEFFEYRKIWQSINTEKVPVRQGADSRLRLGEQVLVSAIPKVSEEFMECRLLLKEDDRISYKLSLPDEIIAPVRKGNRPGTLACYINNEEYASFPVTAGEDIKKITISWCVKLVFERYFH